MVTGYVSLESCNFDEKIFNTIIMLDHFNWNYQLRNDETGNKARHTKTFQLFAETRLVKQCSRPKFEFKCKYCLEELEDEE